mmetsp:Transcript_72142/g.234352  ORF Transcript_72142/g.234352 Transcript_72142/m.234352 type:complete len:290 (-) Transcript_72142:686-1555(-)
MRPEGLHLGVLAFVQLLGGLGLLPEALQLCLALPAEVLQLLHLLPRPPGLALQPLDLRGLLVACLLQLPHLLPWPPRLALQPLYLRGLLVASLLERLELVLGPLVEPPQLPDLERLLLAELLQVAQIPLRSQGLLPQLFDLRELLLAELRELQKIGLRACSVVAQAAQLGGLLLAQLPEREQLVPHLLLPNLQGRRRGPTCRCELGGLLLTVRLPLGTLTPEVGDRLLVSSHRPLARTAPKQEALPHRGRAAVALSDGDPALEYGARAGPLPPRCKDGAELILRLARGH